MLVFYSQKGSLKAGLIQEVAIETGHAVTEIPTWMGLTAKWRAKCVSLAEAKDILAGCKEINLNLNLISHVRVGVRTAPSTIRTCLREAATPLHLLGLYQPQTNKRPSPRSLMCSASRKYPLHSRCLTLISNRNPMWYIEPKLEQET